jgi:hypothetical protein
MPFSKTSGVRIWLILAIAAREMFGRDSGWDWDWEGASFGARGGFLKGALGPFETAYERCCCQLELIAVVVVELLMVCIEVVTVLARVDELARNNWRITPVFIW